jgi:signal transduction histidine kinase
MTTLESIRTITRESGKGRWPLRWQLALTVLVGQVAAVVVISVPVASGRHTLIYRQARESVRARVELVRAPLERALAAGRDVEVRQLLADLAAAPDFLHAAVRRDGRTIAQRGSRGSAPEPEIPGSPVTGPPEILETACAITLVSRLSPPRSPAVLELSVSTEALHREMIWITGQIAFLVLLALLLGIGAAAATSWLIVRGVERLAEFARNVGAGDLSARIGPLAGAELAELGTAFNGMVRALERSHRELEEARNGLERQVEERTQELVQAQQQLVEAEQLAAVGTMCTHFAHEIRNPLGAATLDLELITEASDSCACRDERRTLVAAARRNLARIDHVVQEYLGFAPIRELDLEPAAVEEILAGAASELGAWIAGNRIDVRLDLAGDLPTIPLDRARMRVAVRCMLRNAVLSMPGGGCLTLRTTRRSGSVEVRFCDTGDAIPAEHRSELFTLFHARSPNVTGVGLKMALEILRRHGGSVELEASGPSGSTFVMRLPLAASDARAA